MLICSIIVKFSNLMAFTQLLPPDRGDSCRKKENYWEKSLMAWQPYEVSKVFLIWKSVLFTLKTQTFANPLWFHQRAFAALPDFGDLDVLKIGSSYSQKALPVRLPLPLRELPDFEVNFNTKTLNPLIRWVIRCISKLPWLSPTQVLFEWPFWIFLDLSGSFW